MFNPSMSEVQRQLRELLPRLFRFALTLTGNTDHTEELVQGTCERVLGKAHQWQPGTDFDRWAFTVMRSIWHNELRRQRIRQSEAFASRDVGNIVSLAPDPQAQLENQTVVNAVMQLPEAHREVVILCLVEGQSYAEAAEILELPIGTIMSRLSRARSTLMNRLRDVDDARVSSQGNSRT